MNDLRLTETNSADDSAGKTWGLEGNLFWYLAGGVFTSVIVLLLFFSMWRWSLAASATLAAVPLTLTSVYIFGLRQGKPPGYDRDLVELLVCGPGCGPELHTPHPFSSDV